MTGWFYAVGWVVILTSLVVSIWSMFYARKAKREYLIAKAHYDQAAANYDLAADTLRKAAGWPKLWTAEQLKDWAERKPRD